MHVFCGCNCINSRICHQQTRLSSPSEQGSNWCTSWDMQACTHDTLWRQLYVTKRIINQQPYFVKIFWISISSATTDKTFVQVNWSSFEWIMKERKRGLFLWNTVYSYIIEFKYSTFCADKKGTKFHIVGDWWESVVADDSQWCVVRHVFQARTCVEDLRPCTATADSWLWSVTLIAQ